MQLEHITNDMLTDRAERIATLFYRMGTPEHTHLANLIAMEFGHVRDETAQKWMRYIDTLRHEGAK